MRPRSHLLLVGIALTVLTIVGDSLFSSALSGTSEAAARFYSSAGVALSGLLMTVRIIGAILIAAAVIRLPPQTTKYAGEPETNSARLRSQDL